MKVDLSRLSERPTLLTQEWDAVAWDLNAPGFVFQEPVRIEAAVRRECGVAIAEAKIRSKVRISCARCFADVQKEFDRNFRLMYPLDLTERLVDLSEDIREELILSIPQKILCGVDCKGICVRCGVDLNREKCKCSA